MENYDPTNSLFQYILHVMLQVRNENLTDVVWGCELNHFSSFSIFKSINIKNILIKKYFDLIFWLTI